MSDLKDTIQRLTRRAGPGDPKRLESILRRGETRQRRKRVFTALVAIFIAFGGIGFGVVALEGMGEGDSTSAAPVSSLSSARTNATPPDCPPVEQGQDWSMDSASGVPGSLVTVSGPVPLFGEDGKYAPSDKIEVWWNLAPEESYSVLPNEKGPIPERNGPATLLGTVDATQSCTFATTFEVPDVSPGSYRVVALLYGGGGMTPMGVGVEFQVEGS